MEVRGHNTNGPGDAKKRYQEARFEAISSDRDRVNDARKALVELSAKRSQILREVQDQIATDQAKRTQGEKPDVAATSAGSQSAGDAVELSPVARAQAEPADPAREVRIKELKAAFNEGRLLTQERLERAAEAMLTGSSDVIETK